MGNTVSASNPVEILPVESYINDKCESVESLGSTRFMKVARAKTESGYLSVFKVFVIQDDSLDLSSFRNDILHIRNTLSKAPGCLPIRTIQSRKTHAILVRSYQKYTLFDRLSTRPFINDQERLWYIYQLFKALDQCQKADICHGDLKSQNILLSSANWLQITDFASFKPTFLPHDNPSSFTFFFDTSRRQTCYLAPERFLSSIDYESNLKQKGESWVFGSLTSAMDMFSAGCVVYEILCEGRSPFSYGQLCEYIGMKPPEAASHLEKLLADIPQQFLPLLKLLLNREPAMRMSAQQVLGGTVLHFPPVLDWFYEYFETFRPKDNISIDVDKNECEPDYMCSRVEPDATIARLVADEAKIFDHLKECEESRPYAILVIGLITSHIRSLRGSQAKVDAMRILVKLSHLCDCTVSLERILPYLVYMLSDHQQVTVRVYAVRSIVDLVQPLEPSSVEQSLVFIDYLLPEFTSLAENRNTPAFVVETLAANLGIIAQCAYRFLIVGQGLRGAQDDDNSTSENISDPQQRQSECEVLSKTITDLFVTMSSSDNVIRHSLIITQSLSALFNFFSKIGNDEILIRHMITFLNAKVDWRLRTAFFDALPICVQKRTVDVRSLLQQGLHDYEELVVVRVLSCISVLMASDILERQAILVLLRDIIPFLAHPNDWIRVLAVNILVQLDSRWSLADIQCKILPEVKGYLVGSMLRLNSKVVVMRNLKEPIPRELWKKLMNLDVEQTKMYLACLEKSIRDHQPMYMTEQWYARRFNEICDEDLKWKIHRFGCHFIKMAEFRKSAGMESELTMQKGVIDLTSAANVAVRRNQFSYGDSRTRSYPLIECKPTKNPEWQEIFGTPDYKSELATTPTTSQIFSNNQSVCGSDLRALLSHKNTLYEKGRGSHPETIKDFKPSFPSSIQGVLLTHLHEHSDKITKIATCTQHTRFASSSMDGSIKLWSERALIGECYGAVRSDGTFFADSKTRSPVKSVAWMNDGNWLAVAASNREISMIDINSPEIRTVSKMLLPSNEGVAEELHADEHLIFLRTHHNVIYCLDRRVGRSGGPLGKHEAWRRDVDKAYGLVTSFCLDPWRSNWMVLGVTKMKLLLWDLRYQQEVGSWETLKMIPLRLWSNPCSSHSSPEVFTAFNNMGDVSIYDISHNTAVRKQVLWSSLHQPLVYDDKSISDDTKSNVTYALSVCKKTGAVFTGDAQGALRKWDLGKAHCCEYLSGPRKTEGRATMRITYDEIMDIDTRIIREMRVPASTITWSGAAHLKAATSHRTSITSVECLNSELLASGSADGVIKIWK